MPTLYSHAASNTRKTWILITFFLVLIIGLGWLFGRIYNEPMILVLATIFSLVTSVGSYWFSDKIVLAMTRAKPAKHEEYPDLYHAVENLSITAGLPMPRIYIVEEDQPNAFATGRNEKHAVVAVTRGLLNRLDKPELQGVIAHELAHIKNKDMLLGTVIVVLAGIVINLSDLFWRMGRRSRKKDSGNIIAIIGIVSMILAPILAVLIKMAISRKREFLADASGSLITRYPEGLARALEKISIDSTPMQSAKNATAHLYISNPFKGEGHKFSTLFMTHPPIEQRIKILRDMRV